MSRVPRSAFDPTSGLIYFARMTDKIRLHAAGDLPADYHDQLGIGFDGRICNFLGVSYADLREYVLAGANDEDTLTWCQTQSGRALRDIDILVWNGFAKKRGWRDDDGGTEALQTYKISSGLGGRTNLLTFFDYYEVDEKRMS